MGDEGARALGEALKANTSLRELEYAAAHSLPPYSPLAIPAAPACGAPSLSPPPLPQHCAEEGYPVDLQTVSGLDGAAAWSDTYGDDLR